MNFVCTKENLSHALEIVSGIAGKHINLPILSNILIKAENAKVELVATNLEIASKAVLRAKVEEKGAFTIPAKTLLDYVKLLPEEQIKIKKEKNEIIIECAGSRTKIKGEEAEDFPIIPEVEEKHAFVLDAKELKNSLSQVVFASAKNEIRPELSGVLFSFFSDNYKGLVLAATDSYRLAEKKIQTKQGQDQINIILPARSVYEIIRLLSIGLTKETENNVRMWVGENQFAIRYNDFEIISKLIDGKYPDYGQIIPETFKTTAPVNKDIFINKIKAASLFTSGGANAVSFDLSSEQKELSVSSISSQTGEHSSSIDSDVEGEENSILLNHRYVLDGLQNIENQEIEFKVNSSDSPCLLSGKNETDYLYIVMPIRK